MNFLAQWVGLAFLAALTSSMSIDTGCIAKNENEPILHGSQTHITAWIGGPDEKLTLTLEYGRGFPHFWDHIEVKHGGIEMKKYRDNKEETSEQNSFTEYLNYGWVDLDFTVEEKYKLKFKSQNENHEFTGEKEMSITKFSVEGSNITLNCRIDAVYWKVEGDIVIIPLQSNVINVFSLYSKHNFQPTLAAGNSSVELGFEDNSINDIQRYNAIHQIPLPRYKEHIVKINCTAYQYCTYTVGIDGNEKKYKKKFLQEYTSLAINGNGNEFFVKLNRSTPDKVHSDIATTPAPLPEKFIDGSTIAIIVMGVLLVVILPTTAFVVLKLSNKQNNKLATDLFEEMKPMIRGDQLSRHSSITRTSTPSVLTLPSMPSRLWDAVVHDDQALVKHLLDTGKNPANREPGMPTSPLEEAHLLGHKEIVKMFAKKLNIEQSVPSQDQIEFTLKELEKRIEKVFQAAKYGLYERGNGVNVLLKTNSLPGTIKDSNGWSLIHYMAAVTFSDERPAWEPADIRDFFTHHFFYINAIDHWGNTPLHILAQHKGHKNIMWEGQTISVDKAWIEMAKLFVSYGCDPRIPNHQNTLPHDLAKRTGSHSMATYLKEKFEELGDIDHASAADKFDELIEAAGNNRRDKVINLLKNHVPMLPILAERDPLVEAIRNGHQDVVFLLLSAGTPICNCSIDDLTPLEAAHNTLDLPALFPALMRKIHSDRLKAEKSKIPQADELHQQLAVGLVNIQKSILKHGDKYTKWQFTENSDDGRHEEASRLLIAASGLGLSLTVQILGLENVELRPLPSEESPVDKAQAGDHFDTLYALCRDLKMAPYATHKESKILKRLESDLLIAECNIFKKYALTEKIKLLLGLDEHKVQIFLEQASKLKKSEHNWSLYDSSIFYMFARYGLIYLLKTYTMSNGTSSLDDVIQKFSGTTMLHLSVKYGQQHITEYLLYHGASLEKKTIGGYTAAHIAAILGHKDSMNYIISYMKCKGIDTEDKCDIGMTAKELIDGYDGMRRRCNYPFLKPNDARNVKNEIGEMDMALQILRRKAKQLNIKNKDDVTTKIQELRRKCKESKTTQAEDIIIESNVFFEGINNELFKGTIKECGQHCEDHIIFSNDVIRFTLELQTYSAQGDSKNVEINSQPNEDLMTIKLKTDSKNNIFNGNNFMKTYIEAVKERIQNFAPSNSKVNLAPPFMIPYSSGVVLCWAWNSDSNLCKVRTYIDPVIKADLPENNGIKNFSERIQKFCENIPTELHVNNLKGDWTYRGYTLETQIFKNLNDNEKMVWQICRFIKLLSKKYWWAPTSNIRKSVQRLDVYSVGVCVPQDRALKALFLHELAENPDKWEKKDIFDRVLDIHRRCVTIDNSNNMHPVESVKSFLIPSCYFNDIPESVCGILKFLEESKVNQK